MGFLKRNYFVMLCGVAGVTGSWALQQQRANMRRPVIPAGNQRLSVPAVKGHLAYDLKGNSAVIVGGFFHDGFSRAVSIIVCQINVAPQVIPSESPHGMS